MSLNNLLDDVSKSNDSFHCNYLCRAISIYVLHSKLISKWLRLQSCVNLGGRIYVLVSINFANSFVANLRQ